MQIARFKTREEEPERDHLAEQVTIEGPAIVARRNPVGEMNRIMPSVQAMPPNGLKHLDNLPEAIWETVANAIIHRDEGLIDRISGLAGPKSAREPTAKGKLEISKRISARK